MYSSNQYDNQKSSASPVQSAPTPFSQPTLATGIPVSSMNQHDSGNSQPAQQVQPRSEAPWSSGLCDCGSDVSNCCITFWCPCITFGQISEIVDEGSSSCFANGESPCGDCLVHCCSEPCALCQEYRELKSRGFVMSIGWHGNVERQNGGVAMAPVVQSGMNR